MNGENQRALRSPAAHSGVEMYFGRSKQVSHYGVVPLNLHWGWSDAGCLAP